MQTRSAEYDCRSAGRRRWTEGIGWAVAASAALLGLAMRAGYFGEPLWIDELHTAWATGSTWSDVADRAGQGNQTPFYFWIIHVLCRVTGATETAIRLPSLLFSIGLILAAFQFVWSLTRNITASLLAATLIALDPWCIFYATEARPYSLLQLLAIVQAFSWLRELRADGLKDSRKINWTMLITTAAMLLTHLTSLFLVATQVALVLVFHRELNWKRILLSLSLALVALLPSLTVSSSALHKSADWNAIASATALFRETSVYLAVYIILPTAMLLGHRWLSGQSNEAESAAKVAAFVACWGLGPLVIVCVLHWLAALPVAHFRYIVLGWAALPILAGMLLARIKGSVPQATAGTLVIVAALCINPISINMIRHGDFSSFRNEDWRSAVTELNRQKVGERPLVFLFANLVEDHRIEEKHPDPILIQYLKFPLVGIYPLADRAEILPLPTRAKHRWSNQHLDNIRHNGGAQIIARVSAPLLRSILDELEQLALEHALKLRYQVKNQTGNLISIARVEVEPCVTLHRAKRLNTCSSLLSNRHQSLTSKQ